nr:hypothetical protein [Agrobacterium sp. rho-8.1]
MSWFNGAFIDRRTGLNERASGKASRTHPVMVARFALGSTLSVFLYEVDRPVSQVVAEVPHLRADIDRILGTEYARVKTLLEAERDTVITLSRALKKERRLEALLA